MKKILIGALAALFVVAGCSIADPTASEVALQYGGGPLDSRVWVSCTSGERETHDVNDDHYYYPVGQRDFTFRGDGNGVDSPAIGATTRDGQEVRVDGTVKFTLNTSCEPFTDPSGKQWPGGVLQWFHETIAQQRRVAPEDGGAPMNPTWSELLRNYIGAAIDRSADNEALKYGWAELYQDTAKKAQWEKDVLAQLPNILKTLTQGVDAFHIDSVLLQKPNISDALKNGLTEKQTADLRAAAAERDKEAASTFPGGIVGYQAYQQQKAVNEAITSGKVQVLPIPFGSGVNVGTPGK